MLKRCSARRRRLCLHRATQSDTGSVYLLSCWHWHWQEWQVTCDSFKPTNSSTEFYLIVNLKLSVCLYCFETVNWIFHRNCKYCNKYEVVLTKSKEYYCSSGANSLATSHYTTYLLGLKMDNLVKSLSDEFPKLGFEKQVAPSYIQMYNKQCEDVILVYIKVTIYLAYTYVLLG